MDALQLILARNFNIWNYAAVISNEERAVEAARSWLLLPNRVARCPNCRQMMNVEQRSDYKINFRWRCRRQGCNKTASPTSNTFFDKSQCSVH